MNIVFSLCDGKLASLSPIYIALVTTSSDVNHFNVVSTISNDDSFIDHTIRIETLSEGSAANVTDPLPKIDILSIDDASTRDQDVTITYME